MEPYQPLFLKYRPQSLSDLVGQEYVARTLANAINHDRLSHAYIFTGPRGTGKTSCARILAKSLNCKNGPTVEPCQICTSCLEITQGISVAVLEIDAASNNSVDDARALIERAALVAAGGRYKIYIIDECHMLTKEAFNALLKTVEEPPPNVIFVLATTEEHKVPATILSRCQRLMFRLINQKEMSNYLTKVAGKENIAIDSAAVDLIARRAGGGLRDALGLLDQANLLNAPGCSVSAEDLLLLVGALQEDTLLSMSKNILEGDGASTLMLVNQLLGQGREPYLIAAELAGCMLDLAKVCCFSTDRLTEQMRTLVPGSLLYIDGLIELAKDVDRSQLTQMVEAIDRLDQTCKRSAQPVLNLEIGLLSLCHRLNICDLQAIDNRLGRLESELDINPLSLRVNSKQPKEKSAKLDAVGLLSKEAIGKDSSLPIAKAINSADLSDDFNCALPEVLQSTQSADLEPFWQALLEELKQRHLPTFSLVSTHAFPISLQGNELTAGVLIDNFKKMIEGKMEHIQAAGQAIHGQSLKINIKTVDQPLADKVQPKESQWQGGKDRSQPESPASTVAVKAQIDQNSIVGQELSKASQSNQSLSHLVQDAYRLFEGPGSRLISASQ